MKEIFKGALLIILAMSIFGFIGIFVRFLSLPSQTIVFFNFLITSIMLFAFILVKDRRMLNAKKYLVVLILLAAANVLNNYFFFQAFVLTEISNAVLTHYTAPIFVALLAPVLLKEKIEKITVLALMLSALGLLVMSYHSFSFHSKDFSGIMYGTASGLMYAFVIIAVKHLSGNMPIYPINMYQSFFGALFLAPFTLNSGLNIGASKIFMLLLFAFIFGITATLLNINGIKRVKSQHAGILAYIELVAASIYAFIFFLEIPNLTTVIGGILILFSGYMIIRK